MADYALARRNMVEGQIKVNRVTDLTLMDRMAHLPRERFLPSALRGLAYVDEDLPLGDGRFLMEPMVLARLIDALACRGTEVALTVGCGSGYGAAVLAGMVSTVVGIDPDAQLITRATEAHEDLGIDNSVLLEADIRQGYPEQAPFDVILFEGAVDAVPPVYLEQLSVGGRLAAVVSDPGGGLGKATLWEHTPHGIGHRVLFDAGTPLLPGLEAAPTFEF